MKRLVVLVLLLTSVGAMAQRHQDSRMGKKIKADMTAEQLATLHTKKLILALDLTSRQEQQVMAINLEQAEFRKAKHEEFQTKKESGTFKKPTADERFAVENARLDRQIAHHQKMKEVLTEEQYKTWKKLALGKRMNGKKKMQEKGRRG
ncbi:hypothetical protein [Flagellimonas sp.]|uniref:hypothetical protein n=1 Tax=Flagellimonas sp. TaxID=2058762 RepID=UPI003BB0FF7E